MSPRNPVKGETRLALSDGREYTLVLDHEALVLAESGYGKPLDQLLGEAGQGFVGALRALLYGALQAKQPGATLAAATEMLFADRAAVMDAIEQAASLAFPTPAKDGGKAGNGQAGKTSGGSGAKSGSTRKASGGKRRAPSN